MGKPDGLSRRSGEEKSGIDARFFQEGQLLNIGEDKNDNEGNAEHQQEVLVVSRASDAGDAIYAFCHLSTPQFGSVSPRVSRPYRLPRVALSPMPVCGR